MNPRPPFTQPGPRHGARWLIGCGLLAAVLASCGRAPADANPPGTAVAAASSPAASNTSSIPTGPELVALLNAEAVSGSPVRYVEAQVEAAGPPEPGSGRQGVGYRATIEATEDLFTPVATAEVFKRLGFDLARWVAAVRVRREELRPATLRAAAPANPEAATAPKDGPEDLVLLRRVARRGQRYAAWGHASLVHEVDRWALEEFNTTRMEPALPAESQPRAVFLSHRSADTVFAEDDVAGLRRWASGWNDFAALVEAAAERQRAADAAAVARYRTDPAGYLLAHRWAIGDATWNEAHRRFTVRATEAAVRFSGPPDRKVKFPYWNMMDWQVDIEGTLTMTDTRAARTYRLGVVQAMDDGGCLGLAVAWQAPAGVVSVATTTAIVEVAPEPASPGR